MKANATRRRAAAWSLGFSYLGQALSIVKGIVFVPLYLRHFGVDGYGAWLASANVVSIIGLMELGVSNVLYQQLGHAFGARDDARFARLVGAGFCWIIVLSGLFACAAAIAATFIVDLVNASASIRAPLLDTFMLVSVSAVLNLALANVIAISHAWQRTGLGGSARLLGQAVELAVLVPTLLGGCGLVSLGLAALAGAAVSLAYVLIAVTRIWRQLGLPRPRLERETLRELATTSAPLALSRIAGHAAGNIETTLLAALVSPAAAAIYGITDRMFRVATGFVNPIAGSVLSPMAHLVGERGVAAARAPLAELSTIWCAVTAVVFPVLLVLNRDFTGLWVGENNFGGVPLTVAICASAIAGSRLFFSFVSLTAIGEISKTARVMLAEPLVRIPLMIFGLKYFGPVGLPLGALVAAGAAGYFVLPRILAASIGLSGRHAIRALFAGHYGVIAAFSVAVTAAFTLPSVRTWPGLAAFASAATLVTTVVTCTASGPIRRMAWARTSRLLARTR